ncbi:MAG: tyrosine-type recombinase/integrase [Candidatus Bathyarchaeia archaeon]
MTFVRGSKLRTERQKVITEEEFEEAIYNAEQIPNEFLRLRAKAVLCLLRLVGKRRGEIAILPLENFKIEKGFLNITFILEKKRKGHVLQKLSTKSISLTHPLVRPILEYLEYLNKQNPKPKFFLPQAKAVFGSIVINTEQHISGRQVFSIIRECSETIWPHLFRETVASDIIKEDDSIISAFKVQRRLDLEDFRTGFRYLKRFATDIIAGEEEKLKENIG